jgi:hypothetical protein
LETIAPGVLAVLLALAAFIRAETEVRRQRARLDDVQRRVGADRRAHDPHRPTEAA